MDAGFVKGGARMPGIDPKTDLGRLEPYLADIQQAAHEFGIHPAVLAAVALRETWAGWAPGYAPRGTHLGWGDGGHGFGIFQADDRTWRTWLLSGEALTPLGQARKAASEIAGNWKILALAFPGLRADLIERAAAAAYNARIGAVAGQLLAGRDVDDVTTKGPSGRGDYSADVYARAGRLCRAAPEHFPQLDPHVA